MGSDTKATDERTKVIARRAVKLYAEHASLDRALEDLANRAETGDWLLCDTIWDDLVQRLESHMRFEETSLLDEYAASSPEAQPIADSLREEHGRIRSMLFEMGIAIQLHELSKSAVWALVDLLRAHSHRENLNLYPWAAGAHRTVKLATRPARRRSAAARAR